MWWVVYPDVGATGSAALARVVRSATKPAGAIQSYPTQAAAKAEAAKFNGALGLSPNPIQAVIQGATGNTTASGVGQNPLTAVGQFFSTLGQRATWVRIAKVAIGAIMIITGLNKLTGASSKIEVGLGRVVKGAVA